jgi:hypothetical protein
MGAAKPPAGWRDRVLAVPVLALVAVGCFLATVVLSNGHLHQESSSCRWLEVPWTQFAVAYAAPVAAGLALPLHIRLFRTARRRGWNPLAAWDGRLSVAGAVVAGLLVLLGLVGVWLTHGQAAESAAGQGRPMCEGAARPG